MSDALCSCGACVKMAGKEVYAPYGDPFVWKPDYYPDCMDKVGKPGSYAALLADAARVQRVRDVASDMRTRLAMNTLSIGQREELALALEAIRAALNGDGHDEQPSE